MSDSLRGKTALITGASSGLGADFARELAGRGADLILVARRREALEKLAMELRAATGVKVQVMPTDLSDGAERERLAAAVQAAGIAVDMLVNNAGFGVYGPFADADWARVDQMLQLDVVALTHLTRLFVHGMKARGYGRILQVASTGAFQPTPTYAAYAAAKSYVLSFGLALDHELRGSGVCCTTISPGVTATEFFQVSGQRQTWYHRSTAMSPAAVARIGVRALLAGRSSVVAGWMNAFMAWTTRFMPRPLAAAVTYQIMKN